MLTKKERPLPGALLVCSVTDQGERPGPNQFLSGHPNGFLLDAINITGSIKSARKNPRTRSMVLMKNFINILYAKRR